MTEQLPLNLSGDASLGVDDFFISPANAAAVEAVQSWHGWPQGKMLLVGPARSGKTHLAHIWAGMTGARILDASQIPTLVTRATAGPVVVEDVDQIAGSRECEQALFHLHNFCLAEGHGLLITLGQPPGRLPFSLPDLQSRLQGSALVSLSAPDDTLLRALMVKLFADQQLEVNAKLLDYLLTRMERSFAGASRLVDALNRAAYAQKRGITIPLAGEVLDKLSAEGA